MAKRSRKPRDLNSMAAAIVRQSTGEEETPDPDEGKNPHAVALGRMGGKKGGAARAARLTPERRSDIAKKAAARRWSQADAPDA